MNRNYKETWGDIVRDAPQFDAIVHGCNCFHLMGAGIAAQVRKHYPEAFDADLKTKNGGEEKLGNFSSATCSSTGLEIINAYTQYSPGRDVSYQAIEKAMQKINIAYAGKKIAVPMIGAGIAGGDWSLIKIILLKTLTNVDLTIIYWDGEKEKYNGKFPE